MQYQTLQKENRFRSGGMGGSEILYID